MANDPNPALRTELNAALAKLDPELRGGGDLTAASISAELRDFINAENVKRSRRRDLITAVLSDLDSVVSALEMLEADGYPDFPSVQLPPQLYDELQAEKSDLDAAIAIFTKQDIAAKISINLGASAPKP